MWAKNSKILAVVGGLLLLAGLAFLTIFAPAAKIKATATLDQNAAATLVSAPTYTFRPGGVEVDVTGPGKIFVGMATESDIKAWIGKAAHTTLKGLTPENSLSTAFTQGEKTTPNPAGRDIWINEHEGEKKVTIEWKNPEGTERGLLIASDGASPNPTTVSLTWVNNEQYFFAWPLVALGVLLLGIAWYLKKQHSDPVQAIVRKG